MKIRLDYVTNSSSTSFVVIGRFPSLAEFLELAGLESGESPLRSVFESFYMALDECSEVMHSVHELDSERVSLSASTMARARQALHAGVPVRLGKLRSEGSSASSPEAEVFLCCEHFILENEHVFIDLTDSSW